MARCKDKSVNELNRFGYNVVRHPRAGILPLDVIGRDGGSARHLGTLVQIWKSTEPVPAISEPRAAAGVAGVRSSDLKLSVGLRVLSEMLGALGAAVPQLEFAYSKASSLEFAYDNVESIGVDPFVIGQFLSAGDLDSNNPFVTRYFFDEETSAFVLSEVITSNSLIVRAKDAKGRAIAVDVPAIDKVVGANLGVTATDASGTTVQYQGATPLTIGFKAFEIEFDAGRWQVRGADKDMELERMGTGGGGASTTGPVLLSREPRRISLTDV